MQETGLIHGWGRPLGGGHGSPLQYFFPGESHGQRNWQTTVHGVATLITQDHAANRGQKQELSAKLGPLDSQLKIFYCYLIENV